MSKIAAEVAIFALTGLCAPTATGISYIGSKETFWEHLKDKCLSPKTTTESNKDWKKIQEKLTENNSTEPKSQEFKDLKNKLKGAFTGFEETKKQNGEYLKVLCSETYTQTYKSWFHKEEDLLKDLESFCSLKMKEKIEESKRCDVSKETDECSFKSKLKKELKLHNEQTHGNLSEDVKTWRREDVKTIQRKRPRYGWTDLRDWCKDMYEKPYLGVQSENDFKLVQKYCTKT